MTLPGDEPRKADKVAHRRSLTKAGDITFQEIMRREIILPDDIYYGARANVAYHYIKMPTDISLNAGALLLLHDGHCLRGVDTLI